MKMPLITSILTFGIAFSLQAKDIVDTAVADNGAIYVIGTVPMPNLIV